MPSRKTRRGKRGRKGKRRRKINPGTAFTLTVAVVILLIVVGVLLFGDAGAGEPPWPGAVWSSEHGHWH